MDMNILIIEDEPKSAKELKNMIEGLMTNWWWLEFYHLSNRQVNWLSIILPPS